MLLQKGELLIQWVDRALADCTRWAAEARDNLETSRTRPPAQLAGRRGDEKPVALWERQTGKKPTISTRASGKKGGPFIDFCKAVIEPIYAGFGLSAPSIGSLAQEVLYPPKQERFRLRQKLLT